MPIDMDISIVKVFSICPNAYSLFTGCGGLKATTWGPRHNNLPQLVALMLNVKSSQESNFDQRIIPYTYH